MTEVKYLLNKLTTQQSKLKIYDDYFRGKHKILMDEGRDGRSNKVEVHNYCKLFIENNTGFLLGNPVQMKYGVPVSVSDTTIVDEYQERLGSSIQQIDQKLMKEQQTFGFTFEVNYINNSGEFAVDVVSPLKMAVRRRGNKVVYGLLEKERSGDMVSYDFFDVLGGTITELFIMGEDISVGDSKANIIKNPIIVVKNNWEMQSEMVDIITLNDSYNQVASDATSEINDFRNAYMFFKGMKLDEDILRNMNRSGIIQTVNKDAEVNFVTKDINAQFVENKLNKLEKNIYDMAGQVNFNDTGMGANTSSLALRNKLTNLINKLKLKEGFLREAMLLRLKNLSSYLKAINVGSDEMLDYTTVSVSFIMNIPTSDKEASEMVIDLFNSGLLSKESAITQLSFINSPREEIERIQEEELNKTNERVEQLFASRVGDISEQ